MNSPINKPYQLKINSNMGYSGRYGNSRPMTNGSFSSQGSARSNRSNSNVSNGSHGPTSPYGGMAMVSPRIQNLPSPISHISNNSTPVSLDIKSGNLPPKKIIKAIHSYTTTNPKELSFKEGDFFFVVQELETSYLVCNPLEKTQGLVPRNCFDEVEKKKNAINIDDTNINNGNSKSPLPLPKRQASKLSNVSSNYNQDNYSRNNSAIYSDRSGSSNNSRGQGKGYDEYRSPNRYSNDSRENDRRYDRKYPEDRYRDDYYGDRRNYDDRRDYDRNYDRDYDRDYDRRHDYDYDRDYDRRDNYGRDYDDGRYQDRNYRDDYDRKYDRDYDRDYDRSYNRDYSRDYDNRRNIRDSVENEKDTTRFTDIESDYDIELEEQIKTLNIKTFEMSKINTNLSPKHDGDSRRSNQDKKHVIGLSERVITAIVRSSEQKYDDDDNEDIVYQLEVFKGDGQCYILYRTYKDLQDLIFTLIDQYPEEAGLTGNSKRILPYLLPKEHINQSIVDTFLQYLVQQPQDVQSSPDFIDFFDIRGKKKNKTDGSESEDESSSYYNGDYDDDNQDHIKENARNFSMFFDTKDDDYMTGGPYLDKESIKVKFVCGKDIFAVRVNNNISYDNLLNKAESCILNTDSDGYIERISYSNEFGTDTKLYGNDDLKMMLKLSYPKLIFYINKK